MNISALNGYKCPSEFCNIKYNALRMIAEVDIQRLLCMLLSYVLINNINSLVHDNNESIRSGAFTSDGWEIYGISH